MLKTLIAKLVAFLFASTPASTAAQKITQKQDRIARVQQTEGAAIRDLIENELTGIRSATEATKKRLEELRNTGALSVVADSEASQMHTALALASTAA